MTRRRLLAFLALAALVAGSGCLSALTGGGSIPDEQLDQEPPEPYAWNETETVHVSIRADTSFQAVYRIEGTQIELYRRDGLGGRNALSIRALRYQYPNGTVIKGTTLAERGRVERTGDAVVIDLPVESDIEGDQLAFTAETTPKRFSLPVFVEGSYEVVLPPGRDASVPVFGRTVPRGGELQNEDGRVHVRWSDVTSDTVLVQYYLERDLRIFAALLAGLSSIAGGGLLYYRYRIEQLKKRREEMGLDVDTDDEFGRDPPPGMG